MPLISGRNPKESDILKEGLEANRKICLKQQTELRHKLLSAEQYQEACQLFFKQHAMLHSDKMANAGLFSLEDKIFDELSEEVARQIPRNSEHSIVWNIWHTARIEDITMNILVAGSQQILIQDNWLSQMKIDVRHSGNAMEVEEIRELSNQIDIHALRAYRVAVGRRTREIVKGIQSQELKSKVDPGRIDQIRSEGAVVEAANEIIDYWSKRNIAGLLLMPPTRHNLVHLNESLRLKEKRY
jgi:hypothetical protein